MAELAAVARPYAKAAFEFALKQQQIEIWARFLETLEGVISEPQCSNFINNPISTSHQHEQLITAVLHRFDLDTNVNTRNFVALLAQNKRLLAISAIRQEFENLRANHEKTMVVQVISFSTLSPEQILKLTKRLNERLQRTITLKLTIDPTILGGAIIHAGEKVFDGSVRTQIKKLSNVLAA